MVNLNKKKASHGKPERAESLKNEMVITPSESAPVREQYESCMDCGDMSFAEVLDLFTTGSEEESENVAEKTHLEPPGSDRGRQRTAYCFMYISQPSEADESAKMPKCQTATNALKPIIEEDEEWWQAKSMEELPTFPDWVFDNLPPLLKQVFSEFRLEEGKRRQRDVVLMGALTTLSATFFNVSSKYADKRHWPNLYFYLVAPFGAGKNTLLEPCRELVAAFNKDKDAVPVASNFVLSGNITGPAMLEWLKENNGIGLIFSPEADVLSGSLKGEYAGAMSSILRESFGNSRVDHARRKNNKERLIIETPKLSVLLAGTQKSVSRLFSYTEVEDGLFSRFVFYCMQGDTQISPNLFSNSGEESKEERLKKLGEQYLPFWKVAFSKEKFADLQDWQQEDFSQKLQELVDKASIMLGKDRGWGLAVRNGFICWRIAIALSVIRQAENSSTNIVVTDEDYRAAWAISRVLWYHTIFVLNSYTVGGAGSSRRKPDDLLSQMNDSFSTAEWGQAAENAGVPKDTASKWLKLLVDRHYIDRTGQGTYEKRQNRN